MWNLEMSISRPLRLLLLVTCLAIAVGGCSSGPSPTASPEKERPAAVPFALTSTAFAEGEPIPRKYTCDGEDISPPLQWRDVPEGTLMTRMRPGAPGTTGCSTTCPPRLVA